MRVALTDCFVPILVAVEELRGIADPDEVNISRVAQHLTGQLDQAAAKASQYHHDRTDTELAKFAVCSWADEVLMSLARRKRASLCHVAPLQRHYYNTSEAGVQFYQKLHESASCRPEALAVFELCMALGFRGLRKNTAFPEITYPNALVVRNFPDPMPSIMHDLSRRNYLRRSLMRLGPWLLIPVLWSIMDGLLSQRVTQLLLR